MNKCNAIIENQKLIRIQLLKKNKNWLINHICPSHNISLWKRVLKSEALVDGCSR